MTARGQNKWMFKVQILCKVLCAMLGLLRVCTCSAPTPAVNFTCVSFAWEDLQCTWTQAGGRSSALATTWNVTFTAYNLEHRGDIASGLYKKLENRICIVDDPNLSCRVSSEETVKNMLYQFFVVAENALGRASASFNVSSDAKIVKPPSPTNLSAVCSKADVTSIKFTATPFGCTATLTWIAGGANLNPMLSVTTTQGIQYKVTYREAYNETLHTQVAISKEENVTMFLRELRFFTEYTAFIVSRVANNGIHWSEPVALAFSTCEAAPSAPPIVNSLLGFSYEDDLACSGTTQGRGVTLYWQGIPEASGQSNGKVIGYYVMEGEKVVSEAEGKARQKSFCMSNVGHRITYELVGVTSGGCGIRTSKIHVPQLSALQQTGVALAGLTLRACEISVVKTSKLSVDVTWKLQSHYGSGNVSQGQEEHSSSEGSSKQHDIQTKQQKYVIFWCQFDGRSQCTGDIQWSDPVTVDQHNQTLGRYGVTVAERSVHHYRYGIALWTPHNVSGGITWAGCVHSNDEERNKVPDPHVSHLYDDFYLAKIAQLGCSHEGIQVNRPTTRILYWCSLIASANDTCIGRTDDIPSCCTNESASSHELDWCDYDSVIPGGRNGVGVWIKHIYHQKDYALSSARLSKATNAKSAPQSITASRLWTSAVIWGPVIGVTCFLILLAVLITTYLGMTTVNIAKIKKAPVVTESTGIAHYADSPERSSIDREFQSIETLYWVHHVQSSLDAYQKGDYIAFDADQLHVPLILPRGALSCGGCPALSTDIQFLGSDKGDLAIDSTQVTASTSSSSLGYWRASLDGIHQQDRRMSSDALEEVSGVTRGIYHET